MGTPKTIVALYRMAHIQMLGAVRVIFNLFVADKADFVNYDPDFDDPFAANWQNDIDEAEDFDSDEKVLDQQRLLTEAVEAKMDECRHKFQGSKYFIGKAFPDNATIQDVFGYDNYDKVRNKQLEMKQFMKEFHTTADKYKVQLLAVNYTQPMIDEILTLHDELNTANDDQEDFIKNRKTITQNRQLAYNKIWDTMVQVCEAGQNIYHDNAAKYEQYLIPDSGSTPAVKIKVVMSTVQNPADKVTLGFKGEAGKLVKTVFGDGNIKSITMDGINYVLVGNTYISNGNYTVASEVEIATLDGIVAAGIFLTAVLHPDGLDAEEYDYSNNDLTSIFFLPTNKKAKKIDVSNNNIDQQSMDTMMMTANGWGTDNGYIKADGGTNATLSGQGIAAMNQLIARGWTVITN